MRVEMPDEEQQLAASIVHDDTEQLDAAQEQMLGGIASAIAHIVSGFARGELIAHYAVTDVLAQTLHVQTVEAIHTVETRVEFDALPCLSVASRKAQGLHDVLNMEIRCAKADMASILGSALLSAMSWLQHPMCILLTAKCSSIVHSFTVRLGGDGTVCFDEGAPVTKMFDGSAPLQFTRIIMQWQPCVGMIVAQRAAVLAMEHLYLTAPCICISLQSMTERPPVDDDIAIKQEEPQHPQAPHHAQTPQTLYQYTPLRQGTYGQHMQFAAVSSFAAMHAVETPSAIGVWGEHGAKSLNPKQYSYRQQHTALSSQDEPQSSSYRTNVVPVYLFSRFAPAQAHTYQQAMLTGVYRAPWKNAGLAIIDLEEVHIPWPTRPEPLHLGMPHAGLILETLAPATEPRIMAMVVHLCGRQVKEHHPHTPASSLDIQKAAPSTVSRIVSGAIADALQAVRKSCPGEFLSKTELRLGAALPALAESLANIAHRSRDGEIASAAARAADLERGWACRGDLAHSLLLRLQVAAWKEHQGM